MTTRIPCPSESWDAYCEAQEGPEDKCANCLCDLPEEDPDPANGGDSPWWEGYCSEECKKRIRVPSDEEQLASLDAYGHAAWGVGFSDEFNEDVPEGSDRGDWSAWFDAVVWRHPSRGVLVAYHVVVNSDSGGFIWDTESAVVEADKAPFNLPDYWTGIGMDSGVEWTPRECADALDCNERWNQNLRQQIEREGGAA